ncbi:phytoene desaturase family protein [Agromyces sp. MMS24-JH15]|uniref:phytoene desaturase family protein n=1 Tax=Agromyces sp. MMS24-JH15 TaxID=3243765 RepID=UPI003747B673
MSRAVVIGGGIAGLASAALLARDGHEVTLVEAGPQFGGRAGRWEAGGFRFDTGPSWYLMPEVFEHFFRLFGTTAEQALDLVRLDPAYRVYFEAEPAPLDLRSGREHATAAFEAIEPGAGAALDAYLDSADETATLAVEHFLYTDFTTPRAFASAPMLRRAGRLGPLLFESLDRFVGRRFADRRLRQVLGYPAVFLGTSPSRAPSMYHLMSRYDLLDGVRYPMGGFGELIDAIARLAVDAGAELLASTRATRIVAERGHAAGVEVADASGTRFLEAEVVVAAVDGRHADVDLLPPDLRSRSDRSWARSDPGPSAVLALLGVRGRLPELRHHTLFFTEDWEENFRRVLGPDRGIPDPASLYACMPSATDPTVAPDGHENLFVLVPVPADPAIGSGGIDGAGDPEVEATADRAIAQIAAWAGVPDLAERVVVRRTIGPADFAEWFHADRGSALGPAHVLRQSAFLRGRTASRDVDGLFYAGASTVPGIGLPMCLISAELVAKAVRGERRPGPLPEPRGARAAA